MRRWREYLFVLMFTLVAVCGYYQSCRVINASNSYYNAQACLNPEITDRCIDVQTLPVQKTVIKQIGQYSEDTLHGVVLRYSGRKTVWLDRQIKGLTRGDYVEIQAWNGKIFAVKAKGTQASNYYWHPGQARGVAILFLILMSIAVVIIINYIATIKYVDSGCFVLGVICFIFTIIAVALEWHMLDFTRV